MTDAIPREPTGDECNTHAPLGDGWFAIWYPQMGGYWGKAAVKGSDGCFECYVWHDGQFPFSDDGVDVGFPARQPASLHHCDPHQFIRFGKEVIALLDKPDEVQS